MIAVADEVDQFTVLKQVQNGTTTEKTGVANLNRNAELSNLIVEHTQHK
jgi:hypothetical protein